MHRKISCAPSYSACNSNVQVIIFSVLMFHLVHFTNGYLEFNPIEHCCSLGSSLAMRDLHCNSITASSPVREVDAEFQSVCLSAMELCCAHDLRTLLCEDGIVVAMSGDNCPQQDTERKYCCEACKMGMTSAAMSLACTDQKDNFDCTWNTAYLDCCTNKNSTTLPRERAESQGQTEQNICDLYPGELCAHVCIPTTSTSFICKCHEGFSLMPDGKTCSTNTAQDRCILNNPCQQLCYDSGKSIECSCFKGYELQSNNKSCFDIDECARGKHYCASDEKCHNLPGTFTCEKIKDLDLPATKTKEICNTNQHVCHPELETCVNSQDGYICIPKEKKVEIERNSSSKCLEGYTSTSSGCVDIDECKETSTDTPCDSNQVCENTPGSYKCVCKPGYHLDAVTQACVDINECQVDLHNCASSQRCDNTIGSFQCVRYVNCGTGYTLNAQTGQCEDDDECILNTHNCNYLGSDFICRNTLGSFRCEKMQKSNNNCNGTSGSGKCYGVVSPSPICAPGFEAESGVCIDIDECSKGTAKCGVGQRCINKPGGYICSTLRCESGFRINEDRTRCIDIDECAEQPRLCDHKCSNYWGSYRCTCNPGYKLQSDNRTCIDLNECELFKDRRLCTGYCRNQPGSYSCQCPNGYILASDGASCQDIDECKEGPGCTNPDEVCLNMRGSYRCNLIACPAGYIKENSHKNRCRKEVTSCRIDDRACLNQPTSISFYYITLTSNYTTPSEGLSLFTLRGPSWSSSIDFTLTLQLSDTPANVPPATDSFFRLQRIAHNEVVLKLIQPLTGPQDIQMDIGMTVYNKASFSGRTLSKLGLFVSAYDF